MKNKLVGFIATGEEIVIGDIQDTNATYFAQQFTENGIQCGKRVIVGDASKDIESAIRYLLPDHDTIITIGGLGPTSDDLTRYALADALGLELKFSEQAWQWVEEIYLKKGLVKDKSQIPSTNRQQVLFPQTARVLQNLNGTAAACYLQHNGKDFFMLPGPPNECRPIFHDAVLPILLQQNYAQKIYRKSWLLLGVSESSIAEQLDPLMTDKNCQLGYRVHYPYLEIKLWSTDKTTLEKFSHQFQPLLQNHIISENKQLASQQLLEWLKTSTQKMNIEDHVTGGLLATHLLTPETYNRITFNNSPAAINTTLTGLNDYWHKTLDEKTSLPFTIKIEYSGKTQQIEKKIFYRKQLTLDHAVEIICWELMRFLSKIGI